jgi:hypothetical protein
VDPGAHRMTSDSGAGAKPFNRWGKEKVRAGASDSDEAECRRRREMASLRMATPRIPSLDTPNRVWKADRTLSGRPDRRFQDGDFPSRRSR